jgi:hypothetical protein
MQLPQRSLQRFDFALVINFLTLGQFQSFQNFFHLIERMSQLINDFIHLLDCGGEAGSDRLVVSFPLGTPRGPGFNLGLLTPFRFFNSRQGRFTSRFSERLARWTRPAGFGMSATAASRAAGSPLERGGHILRLFRSSWLPFVWNHAIKLPGAK